MNNFNRVNVNQVNLLKKDRNLGFGIKQGKMPDKIKDIKRKVNLTMKTNNRMMAQEDSQDMTQWVIYSYSNNKAWNSSLII